MSGEPVVLIPPMLCDARVFLDQIGALSCDRTVISVPLKHGETLGEIAQAVLDESPASFALAGAGLGGAIALEIIKRAPERLTRIALINTTAQADTPSMAADRETQIVAAVAGRFADVVSHEMPHARLHSKADNGQLAPLLRQMAETTGADAYILQARALQKRKDQQNILRQIRLPALIVSGDSDPDLPLRRQEFIAEMIPYAQHRIIKDAGFMPTLEQPQQVSDALREWLRQPLVLR